MKILHSSKLNSMTYIQSQMVPPTDFQQGIQMLDGIQKRIIFYVFIYYVSAKKIKYMEELFIFQSDGELIIFKGQMKIRRRILHDFVEVKREDFILDLPHYKQLLFILSSDQHMCYCFFIDYESINFDIDYQEMFIGRDYLFEVSKPNHEGDLQTVSINKKDLSLLFEGLCLQYNINALRGGEIYPRELQLPTICINPRVQLILVCASQHLLLFYKKIQISTFGEMIFKMRIISQNNNRFVIFRIPEINAKLVKDASEIISGQLCSIVCIDGVWKLRIMVEFRKWKVVINYEQHDTEWIERSTPIEIDTTGDFISQSPTLTGTDQISFLYYTL